MNKLTQHICMSLRGCRRHDNKDGTLSYQRAVHVLKLTTSAKLLTTVVAVLLTVTIGRMDDQK
jgi:hypothetical protein